MKTKNLSVLAAITLVFALVFTACDTGGGGGPGGNTGGNQGDQTGTQGQLAFERITDGDNAGTWRVRKGTVTRGKVVIPAFYNGSTGRAARSAEDGDPVTEIGYMLDDSGNTAFGDTGITSIEIPETVTTLGAFAFFNCDNLISITIPASVTEIGNAVFNASNNLKNITVAVDNPNYSSKDGILYTNKCFDDDGEYVYITNNEKTILHSYPSASGSVTIPDSVTHIVHMALAQCMNLTSVTIHAGVTSIYYMAFFNSFNLTSITVDAGNPNYSSEDGVFYNKAKTEIIEVPNAIGSVEIPNSVTSIKNMAFRNCRNLTNVIIPSTVTKIYAGAFAYSTNIKSITIPDTVEFMGNGVFYYWTSSQTINIEGYANQEATDTAWNNDSWNDQMTNWREGCNAVIKYWNGSSYQ